MSTKRQLASRVPSTTLHASLTAFEGMVCSWRIVDYLQ
jgi:hypothetical protein